MKGLRIVLCTGIDKRSKLQALAAAKEAATAFMEGAALHVFDFWETLKEAAQERGYVGKRETITELPRRELSSLRENACFRIGEKFDAELGEVADRSKHVAIVVTRTMAPSPSGFIRTLDETHEVFGAEACITVTDNVQRIEQNLREDPVWAKLSLPRKEVLARRQDEIENAEQWCANAIGRGKHFLLAVNEPPETLLGILFPTVSDINRRKRVYLSFPITHADESTRSKKQEFLSKLRAHWVAFDPGTVTEYDDALKEYTDAADAETKETARLWVERLGPVTVDNDYRLITQSDGIVVYYPSIRVRVQDTNGEWVDAEHKVLSAGVIAEMIHAKTEQRTVEALWLSDRMPSPFFYRYCDLPVFRSEAEFLERLG